MLIQFLFLVFLCLRFYGSVLILFDRKLSYVEKKRAFIFSIFKILASMVVWRFCSFLSGYIKNLTLKKK
jgi:hypothetical protein